MNNDALNVHAMYLDYFNNFLTVERFAEYYGINVALAEKVIKHGGAYHETNVELMKAIKEWTQ